MKNHKRLFGQTKTLIRSELLTASRQRGVALAISLILLVVVTVLGIAAISGTAMQNRMAANQYDRMLAFQAASSVLQVVIDDLTGNTINKDDAWDCTDSTVDCGANPYHDADASGTQQTVTAAKYKAGDALESEPSYILEYLGRWPDPESISGGRSPGSAPSGQQPMVDFYRSTVRSGDPTEIGSRAVVTVQAVLMKR